MGFRAFHPPLGLFIERDIEGEGGNRREKAVERLQDGIKSSCKAMALEKVRSPLFISFFIKMTNSETGNVFVSFT